MNNFTIGIDVGGTKTAYGLFDSDKNLVFKNKLPTNPNLDVQAFFDEIADNVNIILKDNNIHHSNIRGVGIGMPSYIFYEEGRIMKTANLPKIKDFPARSYLYKKLGGNIRIMLDNDAHTAALAEHRNGAGRGFTHMLYCPVSTGISTGIIIDNKLFRGRYGWAGETGHMIATPGEGIECGCGNRGCLMSYCSGAMIVKHVKQKILEGHKTMMIDMAGSHDAIDVLHISQAYDLNDALSIWAIDQMAKYMAVWLYNLYSALNINCFVLGGGLLNIGDKLFDPVKSMFNDLNHCDLPVYFKEAELGDDFGIVGAAELLF